MSLMRVEEYLLKPRLQQSISKLLRTCFSQYPPHRTYLSQLPDFRLLWLSEEGTLLGHLAAEHRIMNANGAPVRVFGVADLCVLPESRKQGIATGLLHAVESLGRENRVEFVVLAAADQSWFARRGYQPVDGNFKWLMIHENQSLGIASRRLSQTIMIKPLGDTPWTEGPVDFLGHIF